MLRHFTAVIAIAMLTPSPSALAQAPAPAPQTQAKVKKVCKSEAIVGTRFAKKICHTPSEWEAIQHNDRSVVEGYQRAPCRSGAASTGGAIQC